MEHRTHCRPTKSLLFNSWWRPFLSSSPTWTNLWSKPTASNCLTTSMIGKSSRALFVIWELRWTGSRLRTTNCMKKKEKGRDRKLSTKKTKRKTWFQVCARLTVVSLKAPKLASLQSHLSNPDEIKRALRKTLGVTWAYTCEQVIKIHNVFRKSINSNNNMNIWTSYK